MKTPRFSGPKQVALAMVSVVCLSVGMADAATTKVKEFGGSVQLIGSEKDQAFAAPRAPLSEAIFPCSQCHGFMKPNGTRRQLSEFHAEKVLRHSEERWCTDCHDLQSRDKLRLSSGVLINFEDSPRLCGQCHGLKLRDWKAGVHGKRTGNWNGEKKVMICVQCHDPHDPKFKALKPLPPPVPRGNAGNAGNAHH